jgi:hypothetical protein
MQVDSDGSSGYTSEDEDVEPAAKGTRKRASKGAKVCVKRSWTDDVCV